MIYEVNARRVYPRLDAALKARGSDAGSAVMAGLSRHPRRREIEARMSGGCC